MMRVLIADDDHATCMVLESFIHAHGLNCDIVHDGTAAVEAASKEFYFITFMDLVMPKENGDEASMRIKSIGNKKFLKEPMIVGMISFDNHFQRKQCLSAGMVEAIVKPLARSDVQQFILLALGNPSPCPYVLCQNRPQKATTIDNSDETVETRRGSKDSWNMLNIGSQEIDSNDLGWTLEVARAIVFLREKQRHAGILPLPSPPYAVAASCAMHANVPPVPEPTAWAVSWDGPDRRNRILQISTPSSLRTAGGAR
jgi:CheY-like chemotaxis protein